VVTTTQMCAAWLSGLALMTNGAIASAAAPVPDSGASADEQAFAQIHVPNRPQSALFEGTQAPQATEIRYDTATQLVTIKLVVQDPKGYFIPNIRRENFAVYENGVRQHNATVEIERSPVSIGILIEHGGRYRTINQALAPAVTAAAHDLLGEIGRDDKVAIWTYGDKVEELAAPAASHDTLEQALAGLRTPPPVQETNLYDALIDVLHRMQTMSGRRALLLISSGIDTFSQAGLQDALRAARLSTIPIYVVNLDPILELAVSVDANPGTHASLDFKRAHAVLRELASVSGGRMYSPQTGEFSAIFDDLMENLRTRYVITYRPTTNPDDKNPHMVRIALVDARTGGPLEIVDATGRRVRANFTVEASYVPRSPSQETNGQSSGR
jgi:Ca-activated chloride channel homolog